MTEPPKNRLLILLSAAHSLNHSFFWIASPILLLITTDLNTSKTTLGLIGTAGSLIYGLGSVLAGSLADRTNETHLIIASTALAGFSVIMFLFARDIMLYAGVFITMCIWTGLYHPASNALISKSYSGLTGEAMGIHGAGGTIGVVFTPVISSAVGLAYGWRMSFTVFGAAAIILALLFRHNHYEPPRFESKGSLAGLFKIRGLWLLLVFNFAVGLYMKSVELFLPTYLALGPLNFLAEDSAIFWAGILTSVMLFIGVFGQWLGGRQADLKGSRRVLIISSTAVLAGFLFLILTPSPLWFIAVAGFVALYGLAFYGHQPAFNALAGFMTPVDRRGLVYGVLFFVSFGMGAISQTITGYISDQTGVTTAFYALSIFAASALIVSFFISDIRENSNAEKTPQKQKDVP